jgi:hypothetical protein
VYVRWEFNSRLLFIPVGNRKPLVLVSAVSTAAVVLLTSGHLHAGNLHVLVSLTPAGARTRSVQLVHGS